MKIINRLYLKVILIATILIVAFVKLYYIDNDYQKKSQMQLRNIEVIKQASKTKIKNLEKELVSYKNEIKKLKAKKLIKKVVVVQTINKINDEQVKNIEQRIIKSYEKIIMYNVHHQILQELKYAPYLPKSQLQEMMQKRFILDNMSFYISIHSTKKVFKGIKIISNKTYSIIRDNELLEVTFVTK